MTTSSGALLMLRTWPRANVRANPRTNNARLSESRARVVHAAGARFRPVRSGDTGEQQCGL